MAPRILTAVGGAPRRSAACTSAPPLVLVARASHELGPLCAPRLGLGTLPASRPRRGDRPRTRPRRPRARRSDPAPSRPARARTAGRRPRRARAYATAWTTLARPRRGVRTRQARRRATSCRARRRRPLRPPRPLATSAPCPASGSQHPGARTARPHRSEFATTRVFADPCASPRSSRAWSRTRPSTAAAWSRSAWERGRARRIEVADDGPGFRRRSARSAARTGAARGSRSPRDRRHRRPRPPGTGGRPWCSSSRRRDPYAGALCLGLARSAALRRRRVPHEPSAYPLSPLTTSSSRRPLAVSPSSASAISAYGAARPLAGRSVRVAGELVTAASPSVP